MSEKEKIIKERLKITIKDIDRFKNLEEGHLDEIANLIEVISRCSITNTRKVRMTAEFLTNKKDT